ncbi:MAG: hypothetical protein ACKOGA_10115 [Planctomycetaceae bacterium]
MSHGVNVLALVKGDQRYIFLFDNQSREQMLKTLERFAADPGLTLTWYDAAVLSQKVRQTPTHNGASLSAVGPTDSESPQTQPPQPATPSAAELAFAEPSETLSGPGPLPISDVTEAAVDARGVWQPANPRFPRPRIPR